jgi:ABC-type branched-subunit amino acid transport system substrate-binding protein
MDMLKRAGTVVAVVGLGLTSAMTIAGASENKTSGSPVKIFVTGPFSDPVFAVPEALSGAQAAAAGINKAGGINGHPIQIVSCNDQLSPNLATSCADKAVSDHVTAATGFILFGANTYGALQTAGIPVVEPAPVSAQGGTSANSFPLSAGTISDFYAVGSKLVKEGFKNIGLLVENQPTATVNAGFVTTGIKAAGGTVTVNTTGVAGSPDFSPYVNNALAGGKSQAIIWVGDPTDVANIELAIKQAGFTGPLGVPTGTIPPATIKGLGSNGNNLVSTSNFYVSGSPTRAFAAGMAKYEPSGIVDTISEGSWGSIYAIADALKGKKSTTAATLTKALSTAKALTDGGITPPINMTKVGQIPGYPRMVNPEVIIYKVHNGKYVAAGPFYNPYAK